MMRKNTRFRLYLALLSACYLVGGVFLLGYQSRAYERRMSRLESGFESKLESLRSLKASEPEDSSSTSSSASSSDSSSGYNGPDYFVLGSGRTGKWGYIDILYLDGAQNRFYFKWGNKRHLDQVMYRLEVENMRHKYGIGLPRETERPSASWLGSY